MIAGIDNTALAMSVATFHILRNEEVLAKLREELQGILKENGGGGSGRFRGKDVSNMPYLVRSFYPECFLWMLIPNRHL